MYSWESKELVELRLIRSKISAIWNHTELEIEDLSRDCLKDDMKKISNIVNDLILDVDTEVDRLVVRDADVMKDYKCSHCESNKIYVCDPCMSEWAKQT